MPDPTFIREGVVSSVSAARESTSSLSANFYREMKGLTSSELEQVMLKATRPDDTPVKGKHVERLVGVTYQISSRYDIYDAVLRKLWAKMAESDWRTTIKALYILHRFSGDGDPEHAAALKARLRELRRTKDSKRKDKFFNSKQLLAGDAKPDNIRYRAFMSRYAHYVLLRVQCFGGMFDEIAEKPKTAAPAPERKNNKKQRGGAKSPPAKASNSNKPITSTNLRRENLEAAAMLLKTGVACQLKEGEDCENTAIAAERVAADLIGLTTAVALALNRALKSETSSRKKRSSMGDDDTTEDDASSCLKGLDTPLIQKWCEFYRDELLPHTRAMVKKTSEKLDAYGLFLPSRMGASVAPEILQKGLRAMELSSSDAGPSSVESSKAPASTSKKSAMDTKDDAAVNEKEDVVDDDEDENEEDNAAADGEEDEADEELKRPASSRTQEKNLEGEDEEVDEYDEYEYDEEEYYDDEED